MPHRKKGKEYRDLEIFVGKRIRQHRLRLSLTQEELAERIDLSNKFISKLENGQNISLNTLTAIAKALEVKPVDLLRMNESAEGEPQLAIDAKSIIDIIKPSSLSFTVKILQLISSDNN